jgi:hypothetical protein
MGRIKAKASLWKPHQKILEAAGLWAFIKDSHQFPQPDQQIVVSFIKTMDNVASLTGMVNLRTVHIKNKDVSQWLKIPGTSDATKVTSPLNKPWTEYFHGGLTAWNGAVWDLEKALSPYSEWLNFVNFHFLFEEHPTHMTMEMLQMSIASWNGKRMDWAKVVEDQLLKQLWMDLQEVPSNPLVQKYLTIVCKGIIGAGNTSTIEKGPTDPIIMVSQEGSSGVDGQTVPVAATLIKKRSQPQSRPKQLVKRNRRKNLSAEAIGEEEEESEQDQLSMDAAIGASKIIELEEQLKEARLHLEQQMNLVGTQTKEISQLQHQLGNEKRVRSVMGSNAIRKDEAIEAARNLTAKTIEGLEIAVE